MISLSVKRPFKKSWVSSGRSGPPIFIMRTAVGALEGLEEVGGMFSDAYSRLPTGRIYLRACISVKTPGGKWEQYAWHVPLIYRKYMRVTKLAFRW